jgi:hypothetical protein
VRGNCHARCEAGEKREMTSNSYLSLYNFTRPVKTLRVEVENPQDRQRWQRRTPAMAAGLTDHVWTVRELLTTVLVPRTMNT